MTRPALTLAPERCDRCMACEDACPQGAVRVSATFVFIDWSRCDGCAACVGACEAGAIRPRGGEALSRAAAAGETRESAAPDAALRTAATPVARASAAATGTLPRLRVVGGDALDEPAKRPALAHIAPLAPSWELWEVAAVLGGVFALFALQQLALSSHWMTRIVPIGAKPLMRSGILTLYYAAQLALLAALGYRKRIGFAEAFGLRRFTLLATAAGIAGLVLVTRLFTLGYAVAAESLGWKMPAGPMSDLTQYFGRDGVGLALTVLMIVIVGPFFEEIVFRGVFVGYLQERIGAWPAIVASAVVFAAFHLNVWMFAPVFVMALAAGYIAVRSRSLWAAYALHLLYNAVPVVLVFVLPK